jgi:hypothetical protein
MELIYGPGHTVWRWLRHWPEAGVWKKPQWAVLEGCQRSAFLATSAPAAIWCWYGEKGVSGLGHVSLMT